MIVLKLSFKDMRQRTITFLRVLKYTNYLLFLLYVSLLIGLGWLEEKKQKKFRNLLHTVFTLGIGILLISLKYPVLIDAKQYPDEVSGLMMSAGIIVLSTLRKKDILVLFKFIRSFF